MEKPDRLFMAPTLALFVQMGIGNNNFEKVLLFKGGVDLKFCLQH